MTTHQPPVPQPRPGALDVRLTRPGPPLSTRDLIAVWADHCPPQRPLPAACPDCGHVYSPTAILCPTEAVIRHTLHRRDITPDLGRLTFAQQGDLLDRTLRERAMTLALGHSITPAGTQPALFDLLPTNPKPGARTSRVRDGRKRRP